MKNRSNAKTHRYIRSLDTEVSIEHLFGNNMSRSHVHSSFELYFMMDGCRRLLLQNNFYKLEKGDLLLIAPGVLHKTLDESPPEYKRIVINFPPKLIDGIVGKASVYKSFIEKEAIIVRNTAISETVANDIAILEAVEQNEKSNFGEFELLIASLLYKLIYFLVSSKNILPNTKILSGNGKHISDILEYINKNYTRTITLTELSSRFYLSEFHLCRSFKKSTGRTIVEYINYLRIEKAKLILTETNTTIKETAKICGFKTTAHFNHVFKEYEKLNPSQFLNLRK